MKNWKAFLWLLLYLIGLGIITFSAKYYVDYIKGENKAKVFERPYKIEILDDHEVRLSFEGDTLSLYFENSYKLYGERCVFIKDKKRQ